AHYHYDLVEEVLRREWGFEGAVMTDWWMRKARSPEFPLLRDNAYRVRAGVDVLMPGDMGHVARHYKSDGTLTESLGEPGGVTRRELERSAARVLSVLAELENRRK
ncbi:MAG: beta-glucosidase, partial [Clostridia bacterium]|nr:beta-glucosidase [Clostridia bacterium]